MYSIYEASLKDPITKMSSEDQDKLLKILEKKNGISFSDENKVTAILKHIYLLDLKDAHDIIERYISPKPKKDKLKRSGTMKKLKEFFNSEIGIIVSIIFLCSIIIFFGLKNL